MSKKSDRTKVNQLVREALDAQKFAKRSRDIADQSAAGYGLGKVTQIVADNDEQQAQTDHQAAVQARDRAERMAGIAGLSPIDWNQPTLMVPYPTNNGMSWGRGILAIILIALLVGAGVWYFSDCRTDKKIGTAITGLNTDIDKKVADAVAPIKATINDTTATLAQNVKYVASITDNLTDSVTGLGATKRRFDVLDVELGKVKLTAENTEKAVNNQETGLTTTARKLKQLDVELGKVKTDTASAATSAKDAQTTADTAQATANEGKALATTVEQRLTQTNKSIVDQSISLDNRLSARIDQVAETANHTDTVSRTSTATIDRLHLIGDNPYRREPLVNAKVDIKRPGVYAKVGPVRVGVNTSGVTATVGERGLKYGSDASDPLSVMPARRPGVCEPPTIEPSNR